MVFGEEHSLQPRLEMHWALNVPTWQAAVLLDTEQEKSNKHETSEGYEWLWGWLTASLGWQQHLWGGNIMHCHDTLLLVDGRIWANYTLNTNTPQRKGLPNVILEIEWVQHALEGNSAFQRHVFHDAQRRAVRLRACLQETQLLTSAKASSTTCLARSVRPAAQDTSRTPLKAFSIPCASAPVATINSCTCDEIMETAGEALYVVSAPLSEH